MSTLAVEDYIDQLRRGVLAEADRGTLAFTEANFLALIRSAEGTPYLYGGTDPFHGGADCSGLIYWAGLQCGVTLPRTTTAEWYLLPHSTSLSTMPVGGCVEFEVPGDGGDPPQHVGVNIGGGYMIDDPETGEVVSVQAIPNVPGVIWPIGWVQLPFVTAPAPAPPAPTPPPAPPIGETKMWYTDPVTGKLVATDANGNIYARPGAIPAVVTLTQHPQWQAGQAESGGADPCVGIVSERDADNSWGYTFITKPASGQGSFGPYNLYHINRDGSF